MLYKVISSTKISALGHENYSGVLEGRLVWQSSFLDIQSNSNAFYALSAGAFPNASPALFPGTFGHKNDKT